MSVAKRFEYLSPEDYLKAEEKASIRCEYVDGYAFEMSGANRRHNIIVGNIFTVLHAFLQNNPCRPFMEAFKVHIKAANCFYYPDVMVACDKSDGDRVYTEEPVLIVEVRSPSTAATDHREKRINYFKLPSLKEYAIVHQEYKRVELFRKNVDGTWELVEFGGEEDLVLESLPNGTLAIPFSTIYRNAEAKDWTFRVREADEPPYQLSAEEETALVN